jgi:beta-glucuronidase
MINIYKHSEEMTRLADREIIKALVKRDKNHASVVLWSIANELASEEEGAYDYFKPLYDLTKECDPQKRPARVVTHLMATPVTLRMHPML